MQIQNPSLGCFAWGGEASESSSRMASLTSLGPGTGVVGETAGWSSAGSIATVLAGAGLSPWPVLNSIGLM